MMKLNRRGFTAAGLVLIILVVAVAALIGWRVGQQQATDKQSVASDTSLEAIPKQPEKLLSVNISALPDKWAVEHSDDSSVTLKIGAPDCFTNVSSTRDVSELNAPSIDHLKQTIEGIKSKGYTVEQLPNEKLVYMTERGEETIDASLLHIKYYDTPTYQYYAYLSTDKLFTTMQLSCADQASLSQAKEALKAITIK